MLKKDMPQSTLPVKELAATDRSSPKVKSGAIWYTGRESANFLTCIPFGAVCFCCYFSFVWLAHKHYLEKKEKDNWTQTP